MKKVFSLSEIDCPVCAGKLEKKVSKIEGVLSCSINFIALKIVVEIEDKNEDKIVENIIKEIKKFDKDIIVEEL